jgi:hypothetical protein
MDDMRNQQLEEENADLRRKLEMLAEEVLALRGEMKARMFLLIAALIVGGRAVLRYWEPRDLDMALDIGFAAVVLVLLGMWVRKGWEELHWMLIPYLLIVFDAAFVTVFHRVAIYALAGAFLFCSTRTCELVLSKLLVILEGLYDRRGKDQTRPVPGP